jgi:hypothetical protein
MRSSVKFYETHPYDRVYYHVTSLYKKAEIERKRRVNTAELYQFTTKPDMEIRWRSGGE